MEFPERVAQLLGFKRLTRKFALFSSEKDENCQYIEVAILLSFSRWNCWDSKALGDMNTSKWYKDFYFFN